MARRVKLDMTGVESYNKASEGQHVAKILSVEEKSSQGGNDMLQFCFEVTKGQDKGCRVYENYPLTDTALWKLKGLLQAIGVKADGRISIDLDKLIGKVLIIEVVWEEYNGQQRARVSECKRVQLEAEDDEDEEEFDEEDFEDDEEEEEEEPPKKAPKKASKKKAAAKKPAKKKEPEPEEDDGDIEEDEDEEEEEVKPAKKKAAKKAPAKKKAASKKKPDPEPEEDDDEEDWDDDDEDWEEA